LSQPDKQYWEVYQQHLTRIAEMLDKGTLKAPPTQIVGPLSVPTVQKAHAQLQEGRVKGKLVMRTG
jgi:NADPH:quinone reductase-like Zn-dependent oxidoreductase